MKRNTSICGPMQASAMVGRPIWTLASILIITLLHPITIKSIPLSISTSRITKAWTLISAEMYCSHNSRKLLPEVISSWTESNSQGLGGMMSLGTTRRPSGRWDLQSILNRCPRFQGQDSTNSTIKWTKQGNTSLENIGHQGPRYGTHLLPKGSTSQAQGCLEQATTILWMRWVTLGNTCYLLTEDRERGGSTMSVGIVLSTTQPRWLKVRYFRYLAPGPGNYRHTSEFGHYDQISSRSQL